MDTEECLRVYFKSQGYFMDVDTDTDADHWLAPRANGCPALTQSNGCIPVWFLYERFFSDTITDKWVDSCIFQTWVLFCMDTDSDADHRHAPCTYGQLAGHPFAGNHVGLCPWSVAMSISLNNRSYMKSVKSCSYMSAAGLHPFVCACVTDTDHAEMDGQLIAVSYLAQLCCHHMAGWVNYWLITACVLVIGAFWSNSSVDVGYPCQCFNIKYKCVRSIINTVHW